MIAQPIHIAHTAAIISTRLCTNSTFASLACDWRQSPSVPAQTLQNPYPRELVVNDGPWVPEAAHETSFWKDRDAGIPTLATVLLPNLGGLL